MIVGKLQIVENLLICFGGDLINKNFAKKSKRGGRKTRRRRKKKGKRKTKRRRKTKRKRNKKKRKTKRR